MYEGARGNWELGIRKGMARTDGRIRPKPLHGYSMGTLDVETLHFRGRHPLKISCGEIWGGASLLERGCGWEPKRGVLEVG